MSARRPDWDRIDQWSEAQYQRLLDYLTDRGVHVERLGPDTLSVRLTMNGREDVTAEVLMTPHEWENLAGIMWGEFEGPSARLYEDLRNLPAGHRYLVYEQYELVPQTTPELSETTIWQREQHSKRRG